MDSAQLDQFIHGKRITFDDSKSSAREFARHLDASDPLASFRKEFLIPSKADLRDPHPEIKPVDQCNGRSSNPCAGEANTDQL